MKGNKGARLCRVLSQFKFALHGRYIGDVLDRREGRAALYASFLKTAAVAGAAALPKWAKKAETAVRKP